MPNLNKKRQTRPPETSLMVPRRSCAACCATTCLRGASLRPGVGATLDALCAGEPLAVGMSGAGTACFAFCRDAAHAEAVRRQALAACPGLALCLCVSANPAPVDPFA